MKGQQKETTIQRRERVVENSYKHEWEAKLALRREKVAELYNAGATREEIAEKFDLSLSTIKKDLQWLREQGIIGNKRADKIAERREQVAKLYNAGKTYEEIKAELDLSSAVITEDLHWLRERGIVGNKCVHAGKDEIAKRRERMAELYNEGATWEKIAEKFDLSLSTIKKDLQWLREQGIIGNKLSGKNEIARRRERIAELYNEGATREEIAEKVGLSLSIIKRDLQWLREQGIVGNRYKCELEDEIAKRRERVAELYDAGATREEIAAELDMAQGTIGKDLQWLREQGRIGYRYARKDEIAERREKVAKLYNEGATWEELMAKLDLSQKTLFWDLRWLRERGIIGEKYKRGWEDKLMERREMVAELYNTGVTYREIAAELDLSITTICKDLRWLREREIVGNKCICRGADEIAERRERVAELYNAGATYEEIAIALGVNIECVGSDLCLLRSQGIVGRRFYMRANDKNRKIAERRKRVLELYNAGATYDEIAREFGVLKSLVDNDVRVLREQGIITGEREHISAKKHKVAERRKRVAELYNAGLKLEELVEEIVRETGASSRTVAHDLENLRKQGIIGRRHIYGSDK